MFGHKNSVTWIGAALLVANMVAVGCTSDSSDPAKEDVSTDIAVDMVVSDHGHDSASDTSTVESDMADTSDMADSSDSADSDADQPDQMISDDAASPDASTACGSITSIGCCDGPTLKYCSILNKVRTIDCSINPTCGWHVGEGAYTCGTSGEAEPTGAHPKDCP